MNENRQLPEDDKLACLLVIAIYSSRKRGSHRPRAPSNILSRGFSYRSRTRRKISWSARGKTNRSSFSFFYRVTSGRDDSDRHLMKLEMILGDYRWLKEVQDERGSDRSSLRLKLGTHFDVRWILLSLLRSWQNYYLCKVDDLYAEASRFLLHTVDSARPRWSSLRTAVHRDTPSIKHCVPKCVWKHTYYVKWGHTSISQNSIKTILPHTATCLQSESLFFILS